MKRKVVVGLIVVLLFSLATVLYGDGFNTFPDIIRFGFPLPFQETFTGKSFDPNIQRERFFLNNLIVDFIILIFLVIIVNKIVTNYLNHGHRKASK
jgi:hypothetical protein